MPLFVHWAGEGVGVSDALLAEDVAAGEGERLVGVRVVVGLAESAEEDLARAHYLNLNVGGVVTICFRKDSGGECVSIGA